MLALGQFIRGYAAVASVAALCGCVSIGGDDGFEPLSLECELDLQTSGAFDGRLTRVEGCAQGALLESIADASLSEISIGAIPQDEDPFEYVEVTLLEPLEDSGQDIAAAVKLRSSTGVSWQTPEAACTASYTSEDCTDSEGATGLQYTVTSVDCSEPALAEGRQNLVIEAFRISSSCGPADRWRLP